jgi:WG containing repeat
MQFPIKFSAHSSFAPQFFSALIALVFASTDVALANETKTAITTKIVAPVDQRHLWCGLDESAKCGIINGEGVMVIGFEYDDAGSVSEGGLLNVQKGEKWGVVDRQNKVVIDFRFDAITPFSKSGLAAAKRGEKWGYINAKGDWVVEPKYDSAATFSEYNVAVVSRKDKYGVIDLSGKVVAKLIYSDIGKFEPGTGLAYANRGGKAGHINTKGEEQVPFTWDETYGFSTFGLAVARIESKIKDEYLYGIVDIAGKIVIPVKYDGAFVCDESEWVMLQENELWGYMSKDGKWQIKPEYDDAGCFRNEKQLAAVKKKNKWGFINTKNQFVIPARYDTARGFSEQGFAPVERDDKWGFIDFNGKTVVPLKYEAAAEGRDAADFLSVDEYIVNSKGQVITDAMRCGIHITMLDGVVTWPKNFLRDNANCKEPTTEPSKKSRSKAPSIAKKR